jgi:hypothetical protein
MSRIDFLSKAGCQQTDSLLMLISEIRRCDSMRNNMRKFFVKTGSGYRHAKSADFGKTMFLKTRNKTHPFKKAKMIKNF